MNAGTFFIALGVALLGSPLARAGDAEQAEHGKVDTQFIFGFTQGADVGELGERELEHQTTAQLGKRDGAYTALGDQLRYETSPIPNFRLEIGLPAAFYRISGVSGLDDRTQGSFNGIATEFRYRLLDRDRAPFALTIGAEPHWNRRDETGGKPVDSYGGDLSVALDKELLEGRIFGAVNFVYDPEATRSRITGQWERDSTLVTAASVTAQLSPGVFAGTEVRYLRKYSGLDLDVLAGRALFLGPTAFVRLSKTLAISGAWNIQVAGRATGMPGSLDLTNFTRHRALLRMEYNF